MSLSQIKEELGRLDSSERRELIGYLIAKENESDEEFKRLLAEEIDNRDPENWVSLAEARGRFAND